MLDKRGVEVQKGQTVIFSMRTGGFGAHEIRDAVVVNVTPKMVRVGYQHGGNYIEGNYYSKTLIVVDLPTGATHTPVTVDLNKPKIKQFKADFSSLLSSYDARLGQDASGTMVMFDQCDEEFYL